MARKLAPYVTLSMALVGGGACGSSTSTCPRWQPSPSTDSSATAQPSPFKGDLHFGFREWGIGENCGKVVGFFPGFGYDVASAYAKDLAALAAARSGAHAESCEPRPGWRVSCWSVANPEPLAMHKLFGPPFRAQNLFDRADEQTSDSPSVGEGERLVGGWAPLEDVEDGTTVLATLNAIASSDQNGTCSHGQCRIVFRAGLMEDPRQRSRDQSRESWESLMSCPAWRALNKSGSLVFAPGPFGDKRSCTLAALWDGAKIWLPVWRGIWRGIGSQVLPFGAQGRPDYTITVQSASALNLDVVKLRVVDALQGLPLSLTVSAPASLMIVGIADRGRASPVLTGYREWGTVQVILDHLIRPERAKLIVTITIAVSRQNVPNVRDGWYPIDGADQETYNKAVLKAARSSIQQICKGTWKDDYTLECP